jgi:hypothetical protein
MFRFIAKWWAKLAYRMEYEQKAARFAMNADLSVRIAKETQSLADKAKAEVAVMEKRVADFAAMEEKGYRLCENGHEEPMSTAFAGIELEIPRTRSKCQKPSLQRGFEPRFTAETHGGSLARR